MLLIILTNFVKCESIKKKSCIIETRNTSKLKKEGLVSLFPSNGGWRLANLSFKVSKCVE